MASEAAVEISLLEGPDADLLVFSNWSGRPKTVRFAVRDVPRYAGVDTVNAKLSAVKSKNGVLSGSVALEGGAIVRCRKLKGEKAK